MDMNPSKRSNKSSATYDERDEQNLSDCIPKITMLLMHDESIKGC